MGLQHIPFTCISLRFLMAIYWNSYILILMTFNFDNHVILMAK